MTNDLRDTLREHVSPDWENGLVQVDYMNDGGAT